MNLPPIANARLHHGLILLAMALFVLAGYLTYANEGDSGDDLSSSYIGCRLVSSGQALEHLYKHDPVDFSAIGPDDAWQNAADRGLFTGYLHPYVQTPLWAYLLGPVCTRVTFVPFKRIFAVLMLFSLVLTVWLIARYWTPSLYHPLPIAAILLLLWFAQPFQYAMFLMQTHALFFLMSVGGLMLAEHKRPGLAGFLLAFAAAVKVTPCLILLYWLVTRRWRAAAWMAAWLAFFSIATVAATGLPLFRLYVGEIGRLGHVLLISQNNQSFAAWWMAHFYSPDEIDEINIWPLPAAMRVLSLGLMVGLTAAGAYLDRKRMATDQMDPYRADRVPLGAIVALLAAMLFAPIAWTHYSIVLIAPLMLLVQRDLKRNAWWLTLLVLIALALNYPPLATNVIEGEIGRFALVRGQFFAGILCMAALLIVAVHRERTPELSAG